MKPLFLLYFVRRFPSHPSTLVFASMTNRVRLPACAPLLSIPLITCLPRSRYVVFFKLFCWAFSPSLLATGDCIGDKSLAPLSVGTSYFIFFNNLTSLLAIILWYVFPRLSSPLVFASVINHLRLSSDTPLISFPLITCPPSLGFLPFLSNCVRRH